MRSSGWLSHEFQPAIVRYQSRAKRAVVGVPHAEFPAGLLDYLGNGRVMNVSDLVKQVVLNLKIEAAYEPSNEPLVTREIDGRL